MKCMMVVAWCFVLDQRDHKCRVQRMKKEDGEINYAGNGDGNKGRVL